MEGDLKCKILTEKAILSKNKNDDLSKIKKLNLWGHKLTDISILKRMPQLIIVSLSANCISTLEPLSHCLLLQELYLRRNRVERITELVYLRELNHLHTLWIGDNPCCFNALPGFQEELNLSTSDLYRAVVIRNLPQVQLLDDIEIGIKERETVERLSLPMLEIPEKIDGDMANALFDRTSMDISSLSDVSKATEITEDSFQPICTKEYNSLKYLGSNNGSEASSVDSDSPMEPIKVGSADLELLNYEQHGNPISPCHTCAGTLNEYSTKETEVFSQNFDNTAYSTKSANNTNPITVAIMHLLGLLDPVDLAAIRDQIELKLADKEAA